LEAPEAPAGNEILVPVPPFTQAQVELLATSVITKVFQFVPSGDHSKVSVFAEALLAAQSTVMLVYPTVERPLE